MEIRIDPAEYLGGDSSDLESVLNNLCALGFLSSVQKHVRGGYLVEVDDVAMHDLWKLTTPQSTHQS